MNYMINLLVEPIFKTSESFLWRIFDVKIVDGAVNGIAKFIAKISLDWRKIQSGIIHDYATITIAGVLAIILYFLFK